jgi:hypothetical protein
LLYKKAFFVKNVSRETIVKNECQKEKAKKSNCTDQTK